MAFIKHVFIKERVYDEFCDRGIKWHEWTEKNVEHYLCSACGKDVDKNSCFCSKCGVKLTGTKEVHKKTSCIICKTKFEQLSHEEINCCSRCQNLLDNNWGKELAKAFYELGKADKKGGK